MLFQIKSSFLLLAIVMLVACALKAPLAVGQDTDKKDTAGNKDTQANKGTGYLVARPFLLVTGVTTYTDVPGNVAEPEKVGEDGKKTAAKLASPGTAGVGESINVRIQGLTQAVKDYKINPAEFVLYLEDTPLKEVRPKAIGDDSLIFLLERKTADNTAWNSLLGRPESAVKERVRVSVGPPDGPPMIASNDAKFNLAIFNKPWAIGSFLFLLAAILVCFYLAGKTNLLRDSGPPNPPPNARKPYSLARVQVAWWFFLVIGSFLLIYLITGEFSINEQALILIGIGTGTALGAAMIDSTKRGTADTDLFTLRPEQSKLEAEVAELTSSVETLSGKANPTPADLDALKTAKGELAEKQTQLTETDKRIADSEAGLSKPVSEGLAKDLVTDASGISFHRFQMIIWTIVLGALFVIGVYKDLAMPQFSATMLALMGISAGTYLGFKIPEKTS